MSQPPPKRLSVITVGCRLNQYESERMAADLAPYGFDRVESGPIDLAVINTCTVTHRADADCRALIRRVVREQPGARVVVAGCYVESERESIAAIPGVSAVIGNQEKSAIGEVLSSSLPELFQGEPDLNCSLGINRFYGHSRAWVKVSDGCNQWCTYCIIPTVRGRLSNRRPDDIVHEIRTLAENGYREVVLTGVNLGHYRSRTSQPILRNLAELCELILKETGIHRLRLSSIEPQTVREDILRLYASSGSRICPHMHLPLQSGSSRILRLMQRPYDQRTYLRKLELIRELRPETIIGADVIVGFPGESEEDFVETLEVVDSGLLDYLHVFSYSDRRGTPASRMDGKIDHGVKAERARLLTERSRALRFAAHKRQIGRVLEVVPEYDSEGEGELFGVAENFLRVRFISLPDGQPKLVACRIVSASEEQVIGIPVG